MQNCAPTQTPESTTTALRAKYLAERDKRLRPEGQKQYLVPRASSRSSTRPIRTCRSSPRPPITGDIDVAILGGGFAGLIAAVRLKQAGVANFRIIELGGDFGGAWYWNRYPGIQCRHRQLLLPPACWRKPATCRRRSTPSAMSASSTAERIGKHFGLYDKAIFSTLIQLAGMGRWDPALADRHQPGRRHPRPVRGHVPGAVQPAEAARHPRHHGLHGAHLPHRPAGTTSTPAAI